MSCSCSRDGIEVDGHLSLLALAHHGIVCDCDLGTQTHPSSVCVRACMYVRICVCFCDSDYSLPPCIDVQRGIFIFAIITDVTLVIRSIDVLNLRRILPKEVSQLSYDVATASLTTALIFLIRDWLQLALRVTGRYELKSRYETYFTVLISLTWLFLTVFGLLQVSADPIWVWRAVKLLSMSLLLITVAIMLGMYEIVHLWSVSCIWFLL
jgi:hypothetical protein